MLKNIDSPVFLLDFIASNLNVKVKEKQMILEENDLMTKAETVLGLLTKELQVVKLKNKIENIARVDIEKQQRDYFLNHQLKRIQKELGDNPQQEEINKRNETAKKKKWPKKIAKPFYKGIEQLERHNPQVHEHGIK